MKLKELIETLDTDVHFLKIDRIMLSVCNKNKGKKVELTTENSNEYKECLVTNWYIQPLSLESFLASGLIEVHGTLEVRINDED